MIEKATGLRLTPHQFRHVAAAIILKHKPGNYELVRLLLGHRTVEITIRNYIGFEEHSCERGLWRSRAGHAHAPVETGSATMIEKAENARATGQRSRKRRSARDLTATPVRSAPLTEWTIADQARLARAIAPRARLRKGGAGGRSRPHHAARSRPALRLFHRPSDSQGRFEPEAGPAAQVSPDLVASFVEELSSRVGSVTTAGTIYKLRRAAELLDPDRDFAWLAEIEKDLALVMRPKSKDDSPRRSRPYRRGRPRPHQGGDRQSRAHAAAPGAAGPRRSS